MTSDEFWRFYCREHSRPLTRRLHVAGSLLGPVAAAALFAATGRWSSLLAYPLISYGFAWGSHFFVEHNKPATFRYPLRSLISDYRMVAKVLSGRMTNELERAGVAPESNAPERA
jgi:hypothetical protein